MLHFLFSIGGAVFLAYCIDDLYRDLRDDFIRHLRR
jgi:hypothetical protein